MLVDAIYAFRCIDDDTERVRAMVALARTLTETAHQRLATISICRSIERSKHAGRRAAALIYIAPLLISPNRWSVLNEGFSLFGDEPTGFDIEELLDAASVALVDAPARVWRPAYPPPIEARGRSAQTRAAAAEPTLPEHS